MWDDSIRARPDAYDGPPPPHVQQHRSVSAEGYYDQQPHRHHHHDQPFLRSASSSTATSEAHPYHYHVGQPQVVASCYPLSYSDDAEHGMEQGNADSSLSASQLRKR
jgi:hypothetical protein